MALLLIHGLHNMWQLQISAKFPTNTETSTSTQDTSWNNEKLCRETKLKESHHKFTYLSPQFKNIFHIFICILHPLRVYYELKVVIIITSTQTKNV